MPKVTVYNMSGAQVGELELSEAVFGIQPNQVAVHAVIKNYLANQRQGTQSTLTRTEVRAAAESPGDRRAPAMRARAQSAPPSGTMAASRSAPSPAITAIP